MTPARDTAVDAQRILVRGWRAMTPADKGRLVDGWSRGVRQLAAAGVRLRVPDATPSGHLIALGRNLYGAEVVDDRVAAAVRRHHTR